MPSPGRTVPGASLSVILCARNPRRDALLESLTALACQKEPGPPWDVIVVDNGSRPPLAPESPSWPLKVTVVEETRPGQPLARVAGIRAASGKILVFVDDDNVLDVDYLANVWRLFEEDTTLGACGGRITPVLDREVPPSRKAFLPWLAGHRDWGAEPVFSPPEENGWGIWEPVGAGLACRRELAELYVQELDAVPASRLLGRSDQSLLGGDDSLLVRGVYRLGLRMAYRPELHLRHLILSTRLTARYLRQLVFDAGRSAAVLERLGHPADPSLPRTSDMRQAAWLLRHRMQRRRERGGRRWAIEWWFDAGFALEHLGVHQLSLPAVRRWWRLRASRSLMDRRRPWSRLQLSASAFDLPRFLESHARQTVWYCANPGNAGDALIASATRQIFRRLRLDVREVRDTEAVPDGQVIFFGGGGNLVPAYGEAARFIARHHERARTFVVLPHTIRGHEALLASLGPNVLLVCRDLPSFEWVRRTAPRARAALGPDLALSVRPWDLWGRALAGLPRSVATRREARRLLAAFHLAPAGPDGLLAVLRADLESAQGCRDRERDLGLLLETDVHDPALCDLASALLLWRVWLSRRVVTDRLHVAIAAAILGRPVELWDNGYGKNRAVWEASLAAEYPVVAFRGQA